MPDKKFTSQFYLEGDKPTKDQIVNAVQDWINTSKYNLKSDSLIAINISILK